MSQTELEHIAQGPLRRGVIALSMSLNEITPELKMLSEKIEISDSYRVGVEGPDRAKYMRGVVLADRNKYAETDTHEGRLSGHCLVLTPDGRMIQLERSGFFSRWSKSWTEWTTYPWPLTLTAAIEEYGLDQILHGIVATIERKIDDKRPRRAARLRKCLKQIEKNIKWYATHEQE